MLENVGWMIRFAVPGGYAVMIGLFEEALFGWAWKTHVSELVSASPSDALSTIGGAVIIGFLLWVIYRALDHRRASSSADLGSGALERLADIPGVEAALERAYGPLAYGLGPVPAYLDRKRRAEIHDERIDAVRSLLRLACKTGDQEIASSYNDQVNWYHVFGACRTTVVVIVLAAALLVAFKHGHAFAANLDRSLLVSLVSVGLGCFAWPAFGALRQRTRSSMTRQLVNDLRVWAMRNPQIWAELAAAERGVDGGEHRDLPAPAEMLARRRHQAQA